MYRVARSLELSLAAYSPSANTAIGINRQREIETSMSGLEGVAARLINRFAREHYSTASLTLSGLARLIGGITYLGNGANASVYKDHDEVIKVYRGTARMPDHQKEEYKRGRQAMCDTLRDQLGDFVAVQTFSLEEHPLGSYQVVIGRQPYVEGGRLDLFKTNTLEIEAAAIDEFCQSQPDAKNQLSWLVDATFNCADKHELVPDLNGVDNFRVTGTGAKVIRLIDAEPVAKAEHPVVHDQILRQAEALGAFLNAA